MNPGDVPRAIDRLRKLHLLGFKKSEQHTILESEFSCKLTALEFEKLYSEMDAGLGELPEMADLRRDLGQTWARAEMLQNDLLEIYSGMRRNYNAAQMGVREHDDGTPVINVRPTEIVAVADKIMKIDQERVNSRINAAKMLQIAAPSVPAGTAGAGYGALPGSISNPAALMSTLVDIDEDSEEDGTE